MKITRSTVNDAASKGMITPDQADRLWAFFTEQGQDTPGFNFTHILYYLGGMIAIGAMSLFITLGWENFGGWGIFSIALVYAAIGLMLLHSFIRRSLPIPAGIMGAFVVTLTPLAIYGLQHALGFWSDGHNYRDYHVYIDWSWLLMELGTLATGAVLLWRYRLPFMVMPVAVTLWYLSMDLTPFLFQEFDRNWELRRLVSLFFGLLMVFFAFWVDVRSRRSKDFAFWIYLFGVIAFWGGLSLMRSDSELNKFIYMCINLGMIFIGSVISRRVFAVFGGLGLAGYLGHLAYSVFKESMLFPIFLSIIGLAVIYLGILWQKNEQRITLKMRSCLPVPLRKLVESFHE